MIGLCHKCGFMGDSPGPAKEPAPTQEAVAIERLNETTQCLMLTLSKQRLDHDQQINELETTLATVLEILMAPTEAKRVSTISKVKKRIKSGDLLSSIRKANSGS